MAILRFAGFILIVYSTIIPINYLIKENIDFLLSYLLIRID